MKTIFQLLRYKRIWIVNIIIPIILGFFLLNMVGQHSQNFMENMDRTVKIALVSSDKNNLLVQELKNNSNLIIIDSIPEIKLNEAIKNSELNYGLIIPDNSQEKINEGKTSEITLYYKNESSSEEIILSAIRNYEIKIAKKRINNLEQNYSYINPISIERISTNNFIENINNNLGKYLPLIPVLFGFLGLIAPCTALFSSRKKGALNYAVKWDKLIGISFSGIMASFFVIMGMWLSIQFFSGHPAFMKGLMKNYLSWKNVFYLIIMILFSHLFWAGLLGYLSQKTKNTLGAFGISFFVFFIFSIFCFIFLSLDFGNISAFIPASNILAYSKSILLGNSNWFSVILSLSGCFIWGILGYFILPNSEE